MKRLKNNAIDNVKNKALVIINLNCDAGCQYCGSCILWRYASYTEINLYGGKITNHINNTRLCKIFNNLVYDFGEGFVRSKKCIDAERKANNA